MTREAVLQPITLALGEVLERDLENLTDETRLFEDLNLDSTTIIELLMTLEDVLGIAVDPDTLAPEHFATVGSLADYVISLGPAVAA
jgi:acyl carrier protein